MSLRNGEFGEGLGHRVEFHLAALGDVPGAIERVLEKKPSGALAPALTTEPHFALPERPGLYRTTMVIRSSTGRSPLISVTP